MAPSVNCCAVVTDDAGTSRVASKEETGCSAHICPNQPRNLPHCCSRVRTTLTSKRVPGAWIADLGSVARCCGVLAPSIGAPSGVSAAERTISPAAVNPHDRISDRFLNNALSEMTAPADLAALPGLYPGWKPHLAAEPPARISRVTGVGLLANARGSSQRKKRKRMALLCSHSDLASVNKLEFFAVWGRLLTFKRPKIS